MLYRLNAVLLSFFFVSCLASSQLEDIAQQWHEGYVQSLPSAEQKQIGTFIARYQKAAYLDAKLRKILILLPHLMAQTRNDITFDERHSLFVTISARAQWVSDYLLRERDAAVVDWDLIRKEIEETASEEMKQAIGGLQQAGQLIIKSTVNAYHETLRTEAVAAGKILEEASEKLGQYAPVYASLFADYEKEEILQQESLVRDYDTAIKLAQSTLYAKLLAVELEFRTAEFLLVFYNQLSDAVKDPLIALGVDLPDEAAEPVRAA